MNQILVPFDVTTAILYAFPFAVLVAVALYRMGYYAESDQPVLVGWMVCCTVAALLVGLGAACVDYQPLSFDADAWERSELIER